MSSFVARHVTQSHMIHVPAAVDRAFSLFEPLGEKHWAHGWDPEILFPASGEAQEGAVFTTQHTGEPVKIWMIIAYEKEQAHVTYANVLPHAYTSRIDVLCKPVGVEASDVLVTYTLTALTPHGNEYIDRFTQDDHYREYISSWEAAIRHYLLHGYMLPRAD